MTGIPDKTVNHGGFRPPWFTLGLTGVAFLIFVLLGPATDPLVWARADIRSGEVWRVFTGHLVHTDLEHLAWNLTALLLIGTALETAFKYSARRLIAFTLGSASVVAFTVAALRPEIEFYAGLSGILNAYLAVLLHESWLKFRNLVSPIVMLCVFTKTGLELVTGGSVTGIGTWQAMPEAHAAGLAVGSAFAILSHLSNNNNPTATGSAHTRPPSS